MEWTLDGTTAIDEVSRLNGQRLGDSHTRGCKQNLDAVRSCPVLSAISCENSLGLERGP